MSVFDDGDSVFLSEEDLDQGKQRYTAEHQFPEYDRYQTRAARRQYLEEQLAAMATEGRLYVTELINQPEAIRVHIGFILAGAEVEEGRFIDVPVPHELRQYKVYLRSIKRSSKTGDLEPIRFKAGHRPATRTWRGRHQGHSITEYVGIYGYPLGKEGTEGYVRLPEAWQVLTQCGEWCYAASSTRTRQMHWTVREVHPDEIDQPQSETIEPPPQKRKRGRPRKIAEVVQ